MADEPDLLIVMEDLLPLSLGPGLILAVVLSELPLPTFLRMGSCATVILELLLRPSARLLVIPAARRAKRAQPSGRRDLVVTLVRRHDRNGKRPGSKRRDRDFPNQLLELKWRSGQNALQSASQPGDLSIELTAARRSVHFAPMLICAQCLALISGLGADRSALRPFPFPLLSLPGSLLRLMLALLAALRLGPSSNDAAAPTSRHRSSLSGTTVLSAPPGRRNHLKIRP